MDASLSSYASSVVPDDEQFVGMIYPRSPPPDAIELTNIPFTSTNFYYNYPNEDDDDLSLYLGVENISNCPNRDMACVSCKDCANIVIDPMVQNHFPVMLHRLLSDATQQDSCMWLPHGRAFVITNNKAHFCANIIPLICLNTILYEVFIDSIEKYGFHRSKSMMGMESKVQRFTIRWEIVYFIFYLFSWERRGVMMRHRLLVSFLFSFYNFLPTSFSIFSLFVETNKAIPQI